VSVESPEITLCLPYLLGSGSHWNTNSLAHSPAQPLLGSFVCTRRWLHVRKEPCHLSRSRGAEDTQAIAAIEIIENKTD
jgi:hypothetical protein